LCDAKVGVATAEVGDAATSSRRQQELCQETFSLRVQYAQ